MMKYVEMAVPQIKETSLREVYIYIDGERKRQGRLRLRVARGDACAFGVDVRVFAQIYKHREISPVASPL